MDALQGFGRAPLYVLSCPGPLRRQPGVLQHLRPDIVSQGLLGYEAQLLAFAAAAPAVARRALFCPAPEFFDQPASHAALWRFAGRAVAPMRRVVHLRFGPAHSVRVIKEARNAAVIAEDHHTPPLVIGSHPFASGLVLPASIRRVLTYDAAQARPRPAGGEAASYGVLPDGAVDADIVGAGGQNDGADEAASLDIVSAREFRSAAWASGTVRPGSADFAAAREAAARDGGRFVLLPWNIDDAGSIVPELVRRLLRLADPERPPLRLLILPFNYPGQTGIVRRVILQWRNAIPHEDALGGVFLGRVGRIALLPALRRIAAHAWIDGNDPEARWTSRRLAAAGIASVSLAPAAGRTDAAFSAEEAIRIDIDTRYGRLAFDRHIPSFRDLPALIETTRARLGAA